MATLKRSFSPFFTKGKPGGSEILDRNLLAIKRAIDEAESTINRITAIVDIDIGGTGINDAQYWLSTAFTGLPNAEDMGALGTGVLQQMVAAGVATPTALPLVLGQVLHGGSDTLIAQSANFYFDSANVRWGFGTSSPSAAATATVQRDVNGNNTWFITNSSAGALATSEWLLQAATADTFAAKPYLGGAMFGRGYVPMSNLPYWTAGNASIGYAGQGAFILDLENSATPGTGDPVLLVTGRTIPDPGPPFLSHQQVLVQVHALTGVMSVPVSLGAGGIVWADPGTSPAGALGLVTIGSGLSFAAGTLAATGGAGTVTSVSGTLPIAVATGTTTPVVSLNYDAVSITLSGAAGTPIQRAALTGVINAAAGSNATTFPAFSAASVLANATNAPTSPGVFAATTAGDVLWYTGAGLVWSPIPESSVTNLVTDLAGKVTSVGNTQPITSTGGTTPVIGLSYDGVTLSLAGSTLQRAALSGVVTASAGSNTTFFAPFAALSVLANATAGALAPTPLAASINGDVLRMAGGVLGWGAIPVASVTGAQPAITWPTAGQVLFSAGTSSDPIGVAGVTVDQATQQLRVVGTGASQGWYNLLSGGNYERYAAYWTSDVWTIESQAGGTGVKRAIKIDGSAAGWTLASANSTILSEVGGEHLFFTGNGATNNFTVNDWEQWALSTIGNQNVYADLIHVQVDASPTLASATSLALDAIVLNAGVTVTGSTHITTATGFNGIRIPRPTYLGDGSGLTIDSGASVYLAGPPTPTSGVTLTNPYTLWIDDGEFRLDGAVATSGGGTPVFGNTPGDPNQAGWLNIISNGTKYMVPLFYRT